MLMYRSYYLLSLQGDGEEKEEKVKEAKEEKGLKFLTPSKLLTRLPVLLAQIKAGYNSYKLKHEIREILYLLYRHNKITKNFKQFCYDIIIMRVHIGDNKRVTK